MVIAVGIFVLLILSGSNIVAKIYDCNSKDVFLNMNEIAFFETTNFPKLLPYDEINSCLLYFYLNETHQNLNYTLKYVHRDSTFIKKTKISDWELKFVLQHVKSNASYLQLPDFGLHYIRSPEEYQSQYTYLIFEDFSHNCPMESISKDKPFNFENDNQMLFIQSQWPFDNSYLGQQRYLPCEWKFNAPIGFGFKILIQTFNILPPTTFRIFNSTDLILNERDAKAFHAYYNQDQYIQISLSKPDPSIINYDEFYAYISIFKLIEQKFEEHKTNCFIYDTDNGYVWTNIDINNLEGYEKNAHCILNQIIESGTQVFVQAPELDLEDGVDFVKYTVDGQTFILDEFCSMIFESYKNGSSRNITWEFMSDGSLQFSGFQVFFTIFKACDCSSKIIKCNSVHHIMDTPDGTYCGNIKCSFNLEKCQTNTGKLKILKIFNDPNFNMEINDKIKILSNNQVVFDNIKQTTLDMIFLNSNNENIIEIETSSQSKSVKIAFEWMEFNLPSMDLNVTLNDNQSIFVLDTRVYITAYFYVENERLSETNTIEIFSNLPEPVLFNNESLTYNLQSINCFPSDDNHKCVLLNISKFYVFAFDFKAILTIRVRKFKNGCVFHENLYTLTQLPNTISNLANKKMECIIFVIIDFNILTSYKNHTVLHLWTTATNENVKIFDDKNLLLEFNSTTGIEKGYQVLSSYLYKIIVPKGAAFFALITCWGLSNFNNSVKSQFLTSDLDPDNCDLKSYSTYDG